MKGFLCKVLNQNDEFKQFYFQLGKKQNFRLTEINILKENLNLSNNKF